MKCPIIHLTDTLFCIIQTKKSANQHINKKKTKHLLKFTNAYLGPAQIKNPDQESQEHSKAVSVGTWISL